MVGKLLLAVVLAFFAFLGVAGPVVVLGYTADAQALLNLAITQFALVGLICCAFLALRAPRSLFSLIVWVLAGVAELVAGYFSIHALFQPLSLFSKIWVWLSLVVPGLVLYQVAGVILAGVFIALSPGFDVFTHMQPNKLRCFTTPGNLSHVFITGGATGLGKALAIKFAAMGAHDITILSRSISNLEKAQLEVKAAFVRPSEQRCHIIPCDVTKFDALSQAIAALMEGKDAPCQAPHLIVTSAGMSTPGYFLTTDLKVFHDQMELNFFGTVNTVRAWLPRLLARPSSEVDRELGRGQLCLVSSALGLMGSIGYSQYCPTKFAVRGLAESLYHELKPHGVGVSVFYPSNMDTESYAIENKTKPIEAKIIDESAQTITPAIGAERCLAGLKRGEAHFTTELLLDLLRVGVNGLMPNPHPVAEAFWFPVVHLVGAGMRWWFDHIAAVELRKRQRTPAPASPVPAVTQSAATPLLGAARRE